MGISQVSELVLESLGILGFYEEFPGSRVNKSSFDQPNEKLLLRILYFFLKHIDSNFNQKVELCWPYHTIIEKNNFKRCLQSILLELVENGKLPDMVTRTSFLNSLKTDKIWNCLWYIADLSLCEFNTTNNTASGSSSCNYNNNIEIEIENEYVSVKKIANELCKQIQSRVNYITDLDLRLKLAIDNIDKYKRRIKATAKDDTMKALTSHGKLVRTQKMNRIVGSLNVVQRWVEQAYILVDSSSDENDSKFSFMNRSSLHEMIEHVSKLSKILRNSQKVDYDFQMKNLQDVTEEVSRISENATINCKSFLDNYNNI